MFLQETDILDLLPLCKTGNSFTPEKSLLQAVLQKAIIDLLDKEPKVREEVFEWFTAPMVGQGDQWGTYYHICLHLDFEPSGLRAKILTTAQKKYLKPTSISQKKTIIK